MSRQAQHCPSVSSKARDKTLLKRFFTMFYSQAQVAVVEIVKYLGAPKAFHKESTCIGCDPQTGVTKFLSRRKGPVIHIGEHLVPPHRDPVMFNLCSRIQQMQYYTWETCFWTTLGVRFGCPLVNCSVHLYVGENDNRKDINTLFILAAINAGRSHQYKSYQSYLHFTKSTPR